MRLLSVNQEIWKDCKGFEGHYQISSKGRCRSLYHKNVKEIRQLKPVMYPSGYYIFALHDTVLKKTVHRYVHRLVAEAFLDNPNEYKYVDHIDCDKSNNAVENLRWTSAKGNSNNPTTILHMCKFKIGDTPAYKIAERNGIPQKTFHARLKLGWSYEQACSIKPYYGNRRNK